MSNKNSFLQISPFDVDGDQLIGQRPEDVPREILFQKFSAKNPVKAIRARCLDCCCGDASEVRKCVSTDCASWPFRIGTNPFRKKMQLSADERLRRKALLQPHRKSNPKRKGLE